MPFPNTGNSAYENMPVDIENVIQEVHSLLIKRFDEYDLENHDIITVIAAVIISFLAATNGMKYRNIVLHDIAQLVVNSRVEITEANIQ